MARRLVLAVMVSAALLVSGIPTVSGASAVSLVLPQGTAFSYLGHSCGGIQEKAYATGFDTVSGDPVGDVYLSTRCGGSGRGGGYHVTTYSAWVGVTWDFTGTAIASTRLASAPTVNPTLAVWNAAGSAEVYNVSGAAYLTVVVPLAPTITGATQVGDQFSVTWTPDPKTAAVLTSSTVTATPVAPTGSPALTATVTGTASSALVGPLQPATTYQITVTNSDAGGTSPASVGFTAVSAAASVAPSAPTGVSASWSTTSSILVRWTAATPGDSPIDQYEITATVYGADPPVPGPYDQTVAGSVLSASFTGVDSTYDWSVAVRAHNAAGWGPWSTAVILGGL